MNVVALRARNSAAFDLGLALSLTLIGSTLAWTLAGGIPAIGIDDAAITRSYAENLAAGQGYVYNVGGERVEGATSLAWVALLTLVYALFPAPEVPILALCGALAVLSIYLAIRLTRHLAIRYGAEPGWAIAVLAISLVSSPSFFLWSVWTMMEIALWTTTILALVLALARLAEGTGVPRDRASAIVGLCLLPLIRPEGIAVGVGLTVLAGLLAPRHWRVLLAGIALAIAVFAAASLWRIGYFGQPFPNTFYAKVSSDTLQDIRDGLKYLFGFLLGAPYVKLYVLFWIGAAAAALPWRGWAPGRRALLIAAACVFGLFGVYVGLGGDHFALWRFYQPLMPLLPVALALGVAIGMTALSGGSANPVRKGLVLPLAIVIVAFWTIEWLQYYQSRFDVRKEFVLVERGVGFGDHLNGFSPKPTLGVGPAGGIALAYDGRILDLFGLNWPEMAHANPVKTGKKNHASFDVDVFWKSPPDVVAAFETRCTQDAGPGFVSSDDAFDGLYRDPQFRSSYLPVVFLHDGECWPAYARPAWLGQQAGEGLKVLTWPEVSAENQVFGPGIR